VKLDDEVRAYANEEWAKQARIDRWVGRIMVGMSVFLLILIAAGY
jgi:hypothetical protein